MDSILTVSLAQIAKIWFRENPKKLLCQSQESSLSLVKHSKLLTTRTYWHQQVSMHYLRYTSQQFRMCRKRLQLRFKWMLQIKDSKWAQLQLKTEEMENHQWKLSLWQACKVNWWNKCHQVASTTKNEPAAQLSSHHRVRAVLQAKSGFLRCMRLKINGWKTL